MSTLAPFYGLPRVTVPPLEITVTRTTQNRYQLAFVDDNKIVFTAQNPEETPAPISYVTDYHARIAAVGYARKWREQGLTVIYRSDLEC